MSADAVANKPAPMSGSSDPSPSSALAVAAAAASPLAHYRPHPHPHHPHMTPTTTTPPSAPAPLPPSTASAPRDYRRGNWTLHETLVLINAKRLDDDRRAGGGAATTPRSAEQRWRWVETYCRNRGCLRSQSQCNDKWDNLLRDYKKVRDYEARRAGAHRPYWSMERHQRKDGNLPTNLAPEVFDALSDVLARRAARRGGAASAGNPPPPLPPSPPKPLLAHPPPAPPHHLPLPAVSGEELSGSSESGDEGSDNDEPEPEPKRRRVTRLGPSVVRGATVLARAMAACEEKRERRHRELLGLEERRLRLEEERTTELRRQGLAGLVSAVNGLSGAIHALVSDHRRGGDSSRR